MKGLIVKTINSTTAQIVRYMWLGKVAGTGNIPPHPCIIIANHESYLDFLLIGYCLVKVVGVPFQFWAKSKIFHHSLWKIFSKTFSAIEVGRNGCVDDLMDISRKSLKGGSYICIFPEGTRSRTGELLPFKQGYLKLASSLGIEVVPVYLENTFYAWPPFKRLPRRKKCNITFSSPIKIARDIKRTDMEKINKAIIDRYHEYKNLQSCG
jgi:1-acyl-sn-glycerol-3-phosphate acyltransferase